MHCVVGTEPELLSKVARAPDRLWIRRHLDETFPIGFEVGFGPVKARGADLPHPIFPGQGRAGFSVREQTARDLVRPHHCPARLGTTWFRSIQFDHCRSIEV
jgi:hypothetical protein